MAMMLRPMSVILDQQNFVADTMNWKTIGDVLAHTQRQHRLVVKILLDGQTPDLTQMPALRQMPLLGRELFIETAAPRDVADEALADALAQLDLADSHQQQAAELLRQDQWAQALQALSPCLAAWHRVQQAMTGAAKLLQIDLAQLQSGGESAATLLSAFARQLNDVKTAVAARDSVMLIDLLCYETTDSTARWRSVIGLMRKRAT